MNSLVTKPSWTASLQAVPFWNVHEGKKTELMSKRAKMMLFEDELEGTIGSFGSDVLSLLICFEATKFVLLSVFILIGTICPKIWVKSMRKNAKSPFPVDVLKLPNLFPIFARSRASELVVNSR